MGSNSESSHHHGHGHKWQEGDEMRGRSGAAEEAETADGRKKSVEKDPAHLRRSNRKRKASGRVVDYTEFSEEEGERKKKKWLVCFIGLWDSGHSTRLTTTPTQGVSKWETG